MDIGHRHRRRPDHHRRQRPLCQRRRRQQYDLISSNEALVTTTAAFGNGSYTLQGNAITMVQDDRKNQPETGFIRMEEESKDEGRTWAPILYLLRVSKVDGEDYEVRYKRTR